MSGEGGEGGAVVAGGSLGGGGGVNGQYCMSSSVVASGLSGSDFHSFPIQLHRACFLHRK